MHSNDPEAESARVLLNLLQARQVPIHTADPCRQGTKAARGMTATVRGLLLYTDPASMVSRVQLIRNFPCAIFTKRCTPYQPRTEHHLLSLCDENFDLSTKETLSTG